MIFGLLDLKLLFMVWITYKTDFMYQLTGKRFGKLFVEKYAFSKNKKPHWMCQCDCGNSKLVKSSYLLTGATKSCGCLRRSLHSEIPYYWIYRIMMKLINEKRYHDFTNDVMSFDDFLTFTKINQCHYCGTLIQWSEHTTYTDKYIKGGKTKNVNRKYNLDRKDNTKGYTKDNCVVCCSLCNYVKGKHLTYDEMLIVGKSIAEIHKKRKAASV